MAAYSTPGVCEGMYGLKAKIFALRGLTLVANSGVSTLGFNIQTDEMEYTESKCIGSGPRVHSYVIIKCMEHRTNSTWFYSDHHARLKRQAA